MIVVDASIVVQWLFRTGPSAHGGGEAAWPHPTPIAAPHLVDAEVGHAIRRQVLIARINESRGQRALTRFLQLPIERFAHTRLLPRAFELRDNATIYDALYIALAEALGARLVTRDAALARIPGVRVKIEVIN